MILQEIGGHFYDKWVALSLSRLVDNRSHHSLSLNEIYRRHFALLLTVFALILGGRINTYTYEGVIRSPFSRTFDYVAPLWHFSYTLLYSRNVRTVVIIHCLIEELYFVVILKSSLMDHFVVYVLEHQIHSPELFYPASTTSTILLIAPPRTRY